MKYSILIRYFILMGLCIIAYDSHAAQINFKFNGFIDNYKIHVSDPFNGNIGIGTPFYGTYTFDTDTINTGTDNFGIYIHNSPMYGIDVNIGGYYGSSANRASPLVHYTPLNYRINYGRENFHAQDIQTLGMEFGGLMAYGVQIYLKDKTQTALDSVDLTPNVPNLDDYQGHSFAMHLNELTKDSGPYGIRTISLNGEIRNISAIPEPTTWLLFGTALVGLVGFGGKRIFDKY